MFNKGNASSYDDCNKLTYLPSFISSWDGFLASQVQANLKFYKKPIWIFIGDYLFRWIMSVDASSGFGKQFETIRLSKQGKVSIDGPNMKLYSPMSFISSWFWQSYTEMGGKTTKIQKFKYIGEEKLNA